ncbi:MAG TPA: RIP metalloprotease RseP [Candidatus Binataceae bacterium]|nr:RIP metalloprotease RseP [Candidatus Binataceae bacterium]
MLTSVIAAVVILGVLILVHEAGHFVVAKWAGVRVLRFSIGYPPKIAGIRRGGTEYAIGATPLGGYVRMLGEEINEELNPSEVQTFLTELGQDLLADAARHSSARPNATTDGLADLAHSFVNASDPQAWEREKLGRPLLPEERELVEEISRHADSAAAIAALAQHRPPLLTRRLEEQAFPHQTLIKRFAIVLAGPLSNIVFAPVLLTVVLMYGVPRLRPILGEVKAGLPAASAGLRAGDLIQALDGRPIRSWEDLSNRVKDSGGAALTIEYERSGAIRRVTLKPARQSEKTPFGDSAPQWVIGVLPRGDFTIHRDGPLRAVYNAVIQSAQMSAMLVVGIGKIFAGSTPVRQALGGPIMIAKMAGHEARQGFASVAMFTVMLSLELGIINLLPVPMLDGGHLLFFVIEAVRGRPLQVRHREIAQQVGLFLLVMLMAFVIFNDISRIVQG